MDVVSLSQLSTREQRNGGLLVAEAKVVRARSEEANDLIGGKS